MGAKFLSLILILILASLVPSRADPVIISIKNALIKKEYSLKLELPNGFQVTNQGHEFHFDFYEIQKDSKTYLAIYSGAAPDFPHEHIEGSEISYFDICIDDGELGGEAHDEPLEPIRILSEWKNGKLVHREILARYSLGGGWPTYLHAITTRHLSEEELQVADRILFSLQLKVVEQGSEGLPSSNE